MTIEIAFSPCPNDTFIFHHLMEHGTKNLAYSPTFLDVEQLNLLAIQEQKFPITKLSFSAMVKVQSDYQLLDCGGALGRGCGPLLIHNNQISEEEALSKIKQILIPGTWTTANLLLHLYLEKKGVLQDIEFIPTRYDKIMPALQEKKANFGLLIHEERFTYKQIGLFNIQDLGEWWEKETGLPIPLGCIAAKKDLGQDTIKEIEDGIRASIQHGYDHPEYSLSFIKKHSQSLNDDVIKSHIDLYVNEFSFGYGQEGHAAIQELFKRAKQTKII